MQYINVKGVEDVFTKDPIVDMFGQYRYRFRIIMKV